MQFEFEIKQTTQNQEEGVGVFDSYIKDNCRFKKWLESGGRAKSSSKIIGMVREEDNFRL